MTLNYIITFQNYIKLYRFSIKIEKTYIRQLCSFKIWLPENYVHKKKFRSLAIFIPLKKIFAEGFLRFFNIFLIK